MLGLGLGLTNTRGGFSPAALFAAGEQGLWLDPADPTTLFQDTAGTSPVTAAGQTVALIRDKSGRGNHASQSDALKRPTYQVDAGGRAYLDFDGTSDALETAAVAFTATDEMFLCAGVNKLGSSYGSVAELSATTGSNAGTFALSAPNDATNHYGTTSRGDAAFGASLRASITASGAAPDTAVISAEHDISGDRSSIWRNGVAGTDSTADKGAGTFGTYALYIGARAGTSLYFSGRLYGLVIRNALPVTGGRATVERWMAARTGVAL